MSGVRVPLRIAANHPALAGHFPQHPIVPGVLLLDEALHALEQARQATGQLDCDGYWLIASIKFLRPVLPNETLQLEWREQPGGALQLEWRDTSSVVASASIERRAA